VVDVLAKVLSYIFHPLLLATYLFGLLTLTLPAGMDPLRAEGHWNFVFLIFCVTFLLPAFNILLFKFFGTIRSVTLEDRRERVVPFAFIAILYAAVTYLFYSRTRIGLSDNLLKFLIIIDVLVLLATIITVFYKISVHSMAIWAFIGILLPLNKVSEEGTLFYPTLASIVVAGLVMAARLQLHAHTPREVMIGAMTGLMASFVSMTILF
jgi:membrane-associated phospholipid phosphatase